jgi:hypothetical protein
MLISWHWTNSIDRSEQQPIETIQCERIGGPDANPRTLNPPAAAGHERSGYQRVGAQDTRYAVMSALYTQSSLPDSKLVSEEEQGPYSTAEGWFY